MSLLLRSRSLLTAHHHLSTPITSSSTRTRTFTSLTYNTLRGSSRNWTHRPTAIAYNNNNNNNYTPTLSGSTGKTSDSVTQQQQTRGMKVRSSVKKLCDGCKVTSPT